MAIISQRKFFSWGEVQPLGDLPDHKFSIDRLGLAC